MLELKENIHMYTYKTKADGSGYNINLPVFLNGKEALVIDTGFKDQAQLLKEDLMSKDIRLTRIVLSHYHPDHAGGTSVFEDVEIHCSHKYQANFNKCTQVWDKETDYKKPTKPVRHGDKLSFGDFNLEFIDGSGHCACGLISLINGKIAHLGDLVMYDAFNKPMLPYICPDGSIQEHLASLRRIKALDLEAVLLSHGQAIFDKDDIQKAIDMRIVYLENLANSGGNIELGKALEDNTEEWSFTDWHKNNLKYV